MTKLEFQEILDKLEQGMTPELTKIVEGQTYTRVFLPETRLILLGGGHIAVPLCAMASMLDFAVTIVDDRISFANSERFPQAAQVICNSFAAGIESLHICATDYVCVITRGHRWDGECLRQILSGTLPGYLGMIGCSMAKMILGMQLSSLLSAAAWVPVCYAGHISMILVYLILLLVLTGLNPLRFLKGYAPVMAAAFSASSSNVVMPLSMKQCGEKLGISPSIYSFSIPLGATINMDGSCITLMITALFAAKIFGLPVTPSMVVSIVVTIIALSMGAPGVPGGNLVCISILLPTIGIPAEAVSIIMGLYSLVGMSQVMTNVTGDAVVTTIVAKWEKAIDLEKFEK